MQVAHQLIRLRSTHPAFYGELRVGRTCEDAHAELIVEFDTGRWTVRHGERGAQRIITLSCVGPEWRVPEAIVA